MTKAKRARKVREREFGTVAYFGKLLEQLRTIKRLEERIANETNDDDHLPALKEMVCRDVTEAYLILGEESIDLLSAILYHWSKRLDELPSFTDGDTMKHEIDQVFVDFTAYLQDVVKVQLPLDIYDEARKVKEWLHGLERRNLDTHNETVLLMFNRLWQMYWFMKSTVYSTSENCKMLQARSTRNSELVYTLNYRGSNAPLCWTSNPAEASGAAEQAYQELLREQVAEFGRQMSAKPVPNLPCYLYNDNLPDDEDRWIKQFAKEKKRVDSFPVNGAALPSPVLYRQQAKWRNAIREQLQLQSLGLRLSKVHLSIMSENGEGLEHCCVFDANGIADEPHRKIMKLSGFLEP